MFLNLTGLHRVATQRNFKVSTLFGFCRNTLSRTLPTFVLVIQFSKTPSLTVFFASSHIDRVVTNSNSLGKQQLHRKQQAGINDVMLHSEPKFHDHVYVRVDAAGALIRCTWSLLHIHVCVMTHGDIMYHAFCQELMLHICKWLGQRVRIWSSSVDNGCKLRRDSSIHPSIYLSIYLSILPSFLSHPPLWPWMLGAAAGLGFPSVMTARPLTAAVSCGLALNCVPATVNVYVYQSNAMCLCYMALWTRRLSKTHRAGGAVRSMRRGFMVCWASEKNEASAGDERLKKKRWFDFEFDGNKSWKWWKNNGDVGELVNIFPNEATESVGGRVEPKTEERSLKCPQVYFN